jgi:hypothetical protein
MTTNKKRIIKSLDNLTDELKDLMKRQYPAGYDASITRIKNAKNEPIFVFPLETVDSVYLIKVPATKNSDGEYDVDSSVKQEFDKSDDTDDLRQADDDDDFNSGGDDYDEEGSGKSGREASYDPDFDN